MSPKQAKQTIQALPDGVPFTVEFEKRTEPGTLRVMECMKGEVEPLKGVGAAYDFGEKGLVPVFDLEKQAYRCFPLDSLRRLRLGEKWYDVKP